MSVPSKQERVDTIFDTKILDFTRPTQVVLQLHITKAGGVSSMENATVYISRYRPSVLTVSLKQQQAEFPLSLVVPDDYAKLPAFFELLGLSEVMYGSKYVTLQVPAQLPDRRLQMRSTTGLQSALRVLTPRSKLGRISERQCCTLRVVEDEQVPLGLGKFAPALGLQHSWSEKQRSTWLMPNNCVVALDEPTGRTDNLRWLTVSGPDEDRIFDTVRQLGYSPTDCWAVSESKAINWLARGYPKGGQAD